MNRKILSVAMSSTMLLSSTAMTAMALENTEDEKVVSLEKGIEIGAIKRSENKTLVIDKDIVLDLNGKRFSSGELVIEIKGNVNVTIKNGTLVTRGTTNVVIVDGGANVIFEDTNFVTPKDSKRSPVAAKSGASVRLGGKIGNSEEDNSNNAEPVIEGVDASGNPDESVDITAFVEKGTSVNGSNVTTGNKDDLVFGNSSDVTIEGESSGGGSTGGSGSGGGSISKPTYTHKEIIGKDRYETAALIADQMGSYDTVVLVNSDKTMADGLSAAPLASKMNAPILPIKQNKIPASILSRINKAKNVYIIGGTDAISTDIEKQLSSKKITRISGKTRFETSQKIADRLGRYSEAYIVNGVTGEADAMSASPLAAREIAPIIITNGKNSDYAKKSGVEYTVIGGEKAVSKELANKYSADRVSGATRYETNREIIKKYYGGLDTVYVANGETMIDALASSVIAKNKGVVLVSAKSDNSILKSKNTVQVGGMKFSIKYE